MTGLIVRRGQIKGVLTRFSNYVSLADSDVEQIRIFKAVTEATKKLQLNDKKIKTSLNEN